MHTYTHAEQIRKCQRANELLTREYAPESRPDLINFVPASNKESRGNLVILVSLEMSDIQ